MIINESHQQNEVGVQETGMAEVCPPSFPNPQHVRHGKIARLPLGIRTELNQRLREGEPGTDLVAWLNSLPEVKQVMKEHFAGAEVNEVNLCRWREGGYQDWLQEELAKEGGLSLAQQGKALQGFTLNDLTQNMALVTMARLGLELRRILSMPDDDARFKCLRDILWAVIFMQRNSAEAERLKRAERKKAGYLLSEEELEKQFWLWAKDPDHKEHIRARLFMSKEEREAAIDEILSTDYWAADEEYIKAIGGELGEEQKQEMRREAAARAKRKEERKQAAQPPAAPALPENQTEQSPPTAPGRQVVQVHVPNAS
jgi:hypothetical protein